MKYLVIILASVAVSAGRLFAPAHDLVFTAPGLYEVISHLWMGFLFAVAIGWAGWWMRSVAIVFLVILTSLEVTMYVTNGDLSMIRFWS